MLFSNKNYTIELHEYKHSPSGYGNPKKYMFFFLTPSFMLKLSLFKCYTENKISLLVTLFLQNRLAKFSYLQ